MKKQEDIPNIPFDSEQQFICAACGEENDLFIELSGGYTQSFIEECYACSKPNLISVIIDPETGEISISNDIAD